MTRSTPHHATAPDRYRRPQEIQAWPVATRWKWGGRRRSAVVDVPVADGVVDGSQGEFRFKVAGGGPGWHDLSLGDLALEEVEQLQIEDEMGFRVVDLRGDARENLGGFFLLAGVADRDVELVGTN